MTNKQIKDYTERTAPAATDWLLVDTVAGTTYKIKLQNIEYGLKFPVVTVTQSATPTINTDAGKIFEITDLAQAITSLTTNLSGSPTKGDMMQMWITDDGTGRAIAPGASFVGTTEFPLAGLTTTANKRLKLLWQFTTVWELSGKLNES